MRAADVPRVIWPLPVSKLHGIGSQTEGKLERIGVKTIGQLANLSEDQLIKMFGAVGTIMHQHANGIDNREIQTDRKIKSISEEITLPKDVYEQKEVLIELLKLAEQVGYRLRKKKLKVWTVTLKIRFADFNTITRARTLYDSIEGDGSIYKTARELFVSNCGRPPWRLVGLQVSNLDSHEQLSLIQEKDEKLCKVVDELKDKYGTDVVKRALLLL